MRILFQSIGALLRLAFMPVCGAALALCFPARATAFESNLPGHRIHEAITREAAQSTGLAESDGKALAAAAAKPDLRETLLFDFRAGALRLLPPNPRTYRAAHHFDRGAGTSHAAAFEAGAAYVRERHALAIDAAAHDRRATAIKMLGEALHALQDFFSHSNYVDLAPGEQSACRLALWSYGVPPPATLRITAYFPDARTPGAPDDSLDYAHDARSKDAGNKNDEARGRPGGPGTATRFSLARAAAAGATADLLRGIRGTLEP